ncbi:acyltransferase family protein [Demequina mangrovi]|uniref:Fucose 4-O-acetylase n=1 Tax=Demequina mangrovi TaxID=1043493 RepID=A0A1H7ABR3_9MICO|nr:acyltransferase [Demequina mangrovi]SEJ59522.1 Fucose 4-O-acetylase [Demequina mangrovi]
MQGQIGQTAAPAATRARSVGPDQVKALLLVLVVFGHVYMVPVESDLLRYLIYSFHMPAFMFLSGYLVNEASLRRRSLGGLLQHYWWRMLLAWLVVSILNRVLRTPDASWRPRDVIDALFLQPAFHLWYVPALMLGLVAAWFLVRTSRPWLWVGAAGVIAYVGTPVLQALVGPLPFNKRYLIFFVYFAYGLMVRNGWARALPMRWALAATGIGLALRIAIFAGVGLPADLSRLVLTLGVVSLIPPAITLLAKPLPAVGPSLVSIGQYSLWIYLLHPLVTQGTVVPWSESWRDVLSRSIVVTGLIFLASLLALGAWKRMRSAIETRQASLAASPMA